MIFKYVFIHVIEVYGFKHLATNRSCHLNHVYNLASHFKVAFQPSQTLKQLL